MEVNETRNCLENWLNGFESGKTLKKKKWSIPLNAWKRAGWVFLKTSLFVFQR